MSGGADAFVALLDDNFAITGATFLGGSSGTEEPYSALMDSGGNLILAGQTFSGDFPVSAGAYATSTLTGSYFIAHMSGDLTTLINSTRFYDHVRGLVLGDNDDLFIGGFTDVPDFATVPGSYDLTFNGGTALGGYDIFLARLTTDLSAAYASGASIGGQVLYDGKPLSGVTMALEGPWGGWAKTDEQGMFSFDLRPDGDYTLTPSMPYMVLTPPSRQVAIAGGSRTDQDFTAVYETGNGWMDLSDNVTPAAEGTYFTDVCFVSRTEGWITSGSCGEIYHTTDGGNTFEVQTVAYVGYLNAIDMQSATTGYAAGEGGVVFMTTNGGADWNIIGSMGGQTLSLDCPPSGDTCYAGGTNGRMAEIIGAGLQVETLSTNYDFQDISFPVDGSEGWAVAGIYIWHKPPYGAWTRDGAHPSNYKTSIFFISTEKGWTSGDATAYSQRLTYTQDAINWYGQIYPDPVPNTIYDIYFLNENQGWAVGTNGTILTTFNGGGNSSQPGWQVQGRGVTDASLVAVHAVDAETVYAVGVSGAFLKFGPLPGTREKGRSMVPIYLLLLD